MPGSPALPSGSVSAATRSPASSAPSETRTRAIDVSSRRMPTITGRTAGVDSRVASARLTWNSARASRSRAFAISVRDRWMATSWPTTIPMNSRTTRLSHSFGSSTVSVYSGRTNRKS